MSEFEKLLERYGKKKATAEEVVEYFRKNSKIEEAHNEIDELPLNDVSWTYVSVARSEDTISAEQYAELYHQIIAK